jgi:hypothetical protein
MADKALAPVQALCRKAAKREPQASCREPAELEQNRQFGGSSLLAQYLHDRHP